jgi:Protein of unknown function (DUF3405)
MMNALLWITHVWDDALEREFERVAALTGPDMPEVWLLLDARTPGAAALATRYPRVHIFEEEALLAGPYPRMGGAAPGQRGLNGIWAHCHYPVLDFHRRHPTYAHYWVVEYDVRYTGAWETLLGAYTADDHDLLTCHLRRFADEPGLWLWNSFSHPTRTIPRERWRRSFNVIYRISRRALAYLHDAHLDGWQGHPEVCVPTLLAEGGFRLLDFGGHGPFVPPGRRNAVYTSRSNRRGMLSPFGTVAFQRASTRPGRRRDTIYHPVKPNASAIPAGTRWRGVLRYARAAVRDALGPPLPPDAPIGD